jgi:hypothetical protein
MPDSIARQIADHKDYDLSGHLFAAGGLFGAYRHPSPVAYERIQVRVSSTVGAHSTAQNLQSADLAQYINSDGLAGAKAFASISDALFFLQHCAVFNRLHILVEPGTYVEDRLETIPNAAHVHIEGVGAGSTHEVTTMVLSRAAQLEIENVTFNFQNAGDYFIVHEQLLSSASTPMAINAADPTQLALVADHFRSYGSASFTGGVYVINDLWVLGTVRVNSSAADGIALKCDGRWHVGAGSFSTPGLAKLIAMGESGVMNGNYLSVVMQDGASWTALSSRLGDDGWVLDTRAQTTTQWGRGTGGTGPMTITFPNAFRIRPLAIVISSEEGEMLSAPRADWSATQFQVRNKVPANAIGDFNWIAVGV